MKMLLIRHGQMAGEPFVRPERPVSGCLSEDVGIPQAEATARALKDTPIDVAFSSSYGRALQTAEIVLDGRDVPIHVFDFLREWQPNRNLADVPGTAYEEICAADAQRYAEETWKTELGEGCFDMYARIIPPLLKELGGIGVHSRMGGFILGNEAREVTLAIFAHGGSLNVILAHLLGVRPFPTGSFAFALTGVATVVFTERAGIYYPAFAIPALHS